MQDLLKKINDRLSRDREEHLDFLKKAISCESCVIDMGRSGNEIEMQNFVSDILKGLGAELDIFEPDNKLLQAHPEANIGHSYENRPNVVGVIKGAGGGKSLMFNAHSDVVPAGDPEAWICPPYQPEIIEGKLYGRGACDMKAGGVAALMALRTLQKCGIRLKGDVLFEAVVDEEGGGNGTLACCLKGYHADAAIIPEPSQLKLMPAHMGWLFYHITFTGKPVHCAFKWNGHNAIEDCVSFINYMQQVEREWAITLKHPYLPPPTVCFTVMQAGNSGSTVPDLCKVDMSVHFHPADTVDGKIGSRIEKRLFHAIDNFVNSSDWLKVHPPKIELFQQGSGYDIGADHPIVECARESLTRVLGKAPELEGLASGADARLLSNYGGIPALICGPGSIGDAHSVNEFVEISQYLDAVKAYCDILVNWCGTV